MIIDRIVAKSIPNTRGRQTIETALTAGYLSATASVPSGKSTGEHEAVELDAATAIENVNGEIARAFIGREFSSPDELDNFLIKLDGTQNKSRLGANAILSASIAAQRLFALQENIPLWKSIAARGGFTATAPRLFVNVMNGGVHVAPSEALAKEGGFKLPFQEYMLVVEGKTSIALPVAQKAFDGLGEMLDSETPMGDEGGYAPTFDTLERPFEILAELVKEFPNTSIAIDAAASQLFHEGAYNILGKVYSADDLAKTYANLAGHFGVRSIEDPFDENAADDFARLTAAVNERLLIVGDDFTCSNPKLISDAINNKAVNAVIIKPNQIGTVSEAIESVKIAQSAGLKVIASHRSGETDDTFISDFAYGVGAYGIKAGGLGQKERLEKYSRLLAIEREAE
ncbi:MAG: enolase C-terminal domain-like protein [Patescibacteria group bacterium]